MNNISLDIFVEGKESVNILNTLKEYGVFQVFFFTDLNEIHKMVKQRNSPFILIRKRKFLNFDLSLLLNSIKSQKNQVLCEIVDKDINPDYIINKDLEIKTFLHNEGHDLYPEGLLSLSVYLFNSLNNLKEDLECIFNNKPMDFNLWSAIMGYKSEKNLNPKKLKPALFLDRDGIINKDTQYLYKIEDVEFVEGAISLIKMANQLNINVIVVTNQSGVGRGHYKEDDVKILHQFMERQIENLGGIINSWYYCLYHPEAISNELRGISFHRKPFPGMHLDAAKAIGIDFKNSIMVGDKCSDYILGLTMKQTFHLQGNYNLDKAKGQVVQNLTQVESFLELNYSII